jgi:hypothetical protein
MRDVITVGPGNRCPDRDRKRLRRKTEIVDFHRRGLIIRSRLDAGRSYEDDEQLSNHQ